MPDDAYEVEVVEKPEEEGPPPEEGLPAWMATFADMVTLLLCFFVLLLSFTNQDIANFEMMKGAMKDAFGVQSTDSSAKELPYAQKDNAFQSAVSTKEALKQLASSLQKFINDSNMNKEASTASDSTGVMLRVNSTAMFDSGSAQLNQRAKRIMKEVLNILDTTKFNLMIMGHTAGESLNDDLLDENWELSATRAAACLRYILDHSKTSPYRLKAVGYSGSKPLVPNTSDANKAVNRRVEFYFKLPDDKDW